MRRIGNRAVSWVVVAAVTSMLSPVSMSFAAIVNDEVTSVKLKEADGTSGQNTNSGSGVKTGHIQDGAVTSTKIGAGAVTNAKLGVAAVGTTNIVDGAVTDAKIAGPISASKISSAGLNADTVDGMHASDLASAVHNHDALYQKKYGKVAVVAQSGGDYTDPVTAMNDISTWCGVASSSNPCLLKIMPGIYNLGSTPLDMMSFVDVEGSGTNNSKIIGTVQYISTGGTELRMISIESGSGPYGRAIDMRYAGYNKLKSVSISVPSASIPGGYDGMGISSSAPQGPLTIEDSVINVDQGYGFVGGGNYLLDVAQLVINNSRISVTSGETIMNGAFTHVNINGLDVSSGVGAHGVRNETGCDMILKNSSIKAGLYLVWGGGNNKIANTQFDGPQSVTAKCINVYDANLNPFTCQ